VSLTVREDRCLGALPENLHSDLYSLDASVLADHKVGKHIKIFDADYIGPLFYYNSCFCNEFAGFRDRHFPSLFNNYEPETCKRLLRFGYDEFSRVVTKLEAVSHVKLIQFTRQKILARYRNAYQSLLKGRTLVTNRLALAHAFVKVEKMKDGDEYKPPRLIQHRSYEYLYMLKRGVLDFSKTIRENRELWFHQPVNTVFTKNMLPRDSLRVMIDSWDSMSDPVALCLDHSTYDARKTLESLTVEHEFWNKTFDSPILRKLLNCQLDNRGYSKGGISYNVRGTRLSGEYTTSDGNSLDNACMLASFVKNCSKFFIFVNGDDSVVFVERSDYEEHVPGLEWFEQFNHKTKLDVMTDEFRRITYCQCSPVRIMGEWVWVKDPIRTITRSSYCRAEYYKCLGRYLCSIGLCELAINSGVPVLQSWAEFLISSGGLVKPLGSVDKIPAQLAGGVSRLQPITDQARSDFEVAFGISIQQQLDMERAFAGDITRTQLEAYIQHYKYFSQF